MALMLALAAAAIGFVVGAVCGWVRADHQWRRANAAARLAAARERGR